MNKNFLTLCKKFTILSLICALLMVFSSCSVVLDKLAGETEDHIDLSNGVITQGIIDANFTVCLSSYDLTPLNKKTNETVSQGSGVVFEKKALLDEEYIYYVLTNNHVIYKKVGYYSRFDYTVRDCYGQIYSAEVVAVDPNYDLAVVAFKSKQIYKALQFASKNPKAGDRVVSIGQPLGIVNAVTEGEVEKYLKVNLPSGDGTISEDISNVKFNVIKHNAPLNSGSSGGMLLDKDYKICGINYAAAAVEDSSEFVSGYAIPVESVKQFLLDSFYVE